MGGHQLDVGGYRCRHTGPQIPIDYHEQRFGIVDRQRTKTDKVVLQRGYSRHCLIMYSNDDGATCDSHVSERGPVLLSPARTRSGRR